jgi:hypothetical protein
MTGRHTFNELFMENVRVPRDCLVGEINRGWYIAAATLDFERSGINRVVAGFRAYEELKDYARETMVAGRALMAEGTVRNKLAELGIEFVAGRLLAYRVASMQAKGQIPNAEASMSKLFGSSSSSAWRGRCPGARPCGTARAGQQMGAARRAARDVLPGGVRAHSRRGHERDHARHHRGPRPGPSAGLAPLRCMDTPIEAAPAADARSISPLWYVFAIFVAIAGGALGILSAIVQEVRAGGFILLPIVGAPVIERPEADRSLHPARPLAVVLRSQLFTALLSALAGLTFGVIEAFVYVTLIPTTL